ncbi:hypothetical protein BGX31_010017 [Mortierella sp. GBA43]|nr:hypothetical protein BGX31_010017 [Mortierella sp. GBA43]
MTLHATHAANMTTATGLPATSTVTTSTSGVSSQKSMAYPCPNNIQAQAQAQVLPTQARVQTPLTPQEWQGLVASGAHPVRQALHSFIATSCEKPPETKEEARAVLEEMFQIRAGRIRRAIEEGKLSTAEALKHKVIQRRESVVEGTLKNSRRDIVPSRAMSAPSESKVPSLTRDFSNSVSPQGQLWAQPQLTGEPTMIMADATLSQGLQGDIMNATSMEAGLFGEQATTFGLSDDDLMSSFTTFTAKLGDSLLPKTEPPTDCVPVFGGISQGRGHLAPHGQLPAQIQSSVPSLSPPTMGSPTASNESQSPSPWMSWISPEQSLLAGNGHKTLYAAQPALQPQPQPQPLQPSQPMMMHPMALPAYSGAQQPFSMSTDPRLVESHMLYQQGLFTPAGGATAAGGKPLPAGTWNQYMQYLMYQQDTGIQPSNPAIVLQQQYSRQPQASQQSYQQAPLDPHWQATMMTMMMDSNSTIDRSGRVDHTSSSVAFPATGFQGQHQPGL